MSEGPAKRRWTVYILRCGDGTLYTGCTNDLPRRLEAHRRGRGAKYTRSRLPVALVYQEAAADKSAALRGEMAVKALTRAQKLALIERGRNAYGDSPAEGDRQPAGDQPHL